MTALSRRVAAISPDTCSRILTISSGFVNSTWLAPAYRHAANIQKSCFNPITTTVLVIQNSLLCRFTKLSTNQPPVLRPLCVSTCINLNGPSRYKLEDFVGAKFYSPHALAGSNRCTRIKENLLLESRVLLNNFMYTVFVPWNSHLEKIHDRCLQSTNAPWLGFGLSVIWSLFGVRVVRWQGGHQARKKATYLVKLVRQTCRWRDKYSTLHQLTKQKCKVVVKHTQPPAMISPQCGTTPSDDDSLSRMKSFTYRQKHTNAEDCPRVLPSVLWRCWLGGRKGIRPVRKLSGEVVAWLSVWSEVQICIWPSWCHCHSLSLASVKSRLVLPFRYWLTQVVLDKGPLNGCVC